MKNFEYFLERVKARKINEEVFNTEKETKLKNHEQKLQYYNANKNKFKSIFSQSEDKWEEDAEKIINGNVYLSHMWRVNKIENNITKLEDQLRNAELSNEEKQDMENKIAENKDKLKEQEKELEKKIKDDLSEIENL